MNKIAIENSRHDSRIAEIVYFALIRSFGSLQIAWPTKATADQYLGVVAINPDESLLELARGGKKIIALGQLDSRLRKAFGIIEKIKGPYWNCLWDIHPGKHHDASSGSVQYLADNKLVVNCPLKERNLLRYDFEREWNNHGYGGIENHDPTWGISFRAEPSGSIQPIAWVIDQQGQHAGMYAALIDFPEASILWFNRPVGPVDSLEWTIVETFFSEYRSDDLTCFPYILEVPYGYAGSVCMHADCDEAISSGKELFELYREHNIPFSLAIKTEQEIASTDLDFMKHVLRIGGSISSHSRNHFENWGGEPSTAYREAIESKQWLEDQATEGKPVHYAVSPFYQNPPYAVKALEKAGYKGFVGGIICNDPEYLIGRAGLIPFSDGMIVSHSQQCMLHGDCFHRYGNSIAPYIEAFEYHMKAGAFFGYLDHPFSKRYSYGWYNEQERLDAHAKLIAYMKNFGHIWFTNLDQCLNFVRKKSAASVCVDESGALQSCYIPDYQMSLPDLAVSFRGEITRLVNTRINLRK
jgi:hypothetical protein